MPKRAASGSQDIPSAQNFSPNEIDLPAVLELARLHEGKRTDFREAIRLRFYSERPIPRRGGTVWGNVVSGMVQFGLIDAAAKLTDLGEELYTLRQDQKALFRRFALHLLLNLQGSVFLDTLMDMQRAGERPTLPTIREALEERGVHTSDAGKSISLLRLWLAKAGLFRSQWVPNMRVYDDILGKTEAELDALADLTPGERAVMKMLATMGPGRYDSSELRKATERAYAITLNEKLFSKPLSRLRDLGYITLTRKGGRGWGFWVEPTGKLDTDVVIPLLDQLSGLPKSLRSLLRLSLAEIVARLDGGRHAKGLALEALGFKLMRIVGLSYIDTRYRPDDGPSFEVDLLFHSDRPAYSRWQVQCKNTERVALDDIAKEVGLTYYLLSNVILILTRGSVGEDARRYAIDVMKKTNLAIILIEKEDVEAIVANPLFVFEVLEREAQFALEMKPLIAPRVTPLAP